MGHSIPSSYIQETDPGRSESSCAILAQGQNCHTCLSLPSGTGPAVHRTRGPRCQHVSEPAAQEESRQAWKVISRWELTGSD